MASANVEKVKLEKLVLEVDAELEGLNVGGLRTIAEWLGRRSTSLVQLDRVAVLRAISRSIDRAPVSTDVTLRQKIQEAMLNPDNWEQSLSTQRYSVSSASETDTPAAEAEEGRDFSYVPPPGLGRGRGLMIRPRAGAGRGAALLSPYQSPATTCSSLPSLQLPAVSPDPARRMLPFTPSTGMRNTPPWNVAGIGRGRGINILRESDADSSLHGSVRRANPTYTITEVGSSSTDTDEEERKIQELQEELKRLKTKKRNRDSARSSTSSSSGGSRRSSRAGKVSSKQKVKKICQSDYSSDDAATARKPQNRPKSSTKKPHGIISPKVKKKSTGKCCDTSDVKKTSKSTKSKCRTSKQSSVCSEEDSSGSADHRSCVGRKAGVSCPDVVGSGGGGSAVSTSVVVAAPDTKDSTLCTVKELKDAWRREFKIKGQIGKIGEKDSKLDYISVKRQVDAGVKKENEDADIVEGIIICCTAGTTLRSFLESSSDLTVAVVMDILRSYFQEADSVDLLQQLSTARQSAKENALSFLYRVLNIKNRIIRLEDDDVGFSESTVVKIMLKTLQAGIPDDFVLNYIRPHLTPGITDNKLLSEVSKAVTLCKKRAEWFKSTPRVSSLQESSDDLDRISRLEVRLNQLMEKKQDRNRRQYGCKNCKSAGTGKSCEHCFVCGKGDHRYQAFSERKCDGGNDKKDQSSNSNRSSAWDL